MKPGSATLLVAGILLAFIVLGYVLKSRHATVVVTSIPAPVTATAPAQAPVKVPDRPAPGRLAFPLPGFEHALRDNFDEKRGMRKHEALDIMAPRGTPVRAVDNGRIAKLYRGPMAGISIYQFDPATTRVYFYAHLDRYAPGLEEGGPVARGDVIGYVGSTGNAPERAPHLHFAILELGPEKRWWRGKAINPYSLLLQPP